MPVQAGEARQCRSEVWSLIDEGGHGCRTDGDCGQ
jgi:hypothetical protein